MKNKKDEVEVLSDQMCKAINNALKCASNLSQNNHLTDPFYPLTVLVNKLYSNSITELYKLVQLDVQKEFNDLLNQIKNDLFLERDNYDVKHVLERIEAYERKYNNDHKSN